MNYAVIKLLKRLPEKVRHTLIGLIDKHAAERLFQRGWAVDFRGNKDKVEEYWKRFRYLDELCQAAELSERSRVLDVGCGISTVLHFIPGDRVGIDPNADVYRGYYAYPKELDILNASGEAIPFENGSFDVVFCSNVLDHVTSPEKTVSEIARVLKPKGFFILTVEIFPATATRDPAHPHCMTYSDVQGLIASNFTVDWEKTSPWVGLGLRHYVKDEVPANENQELVLLLRKQR